MQRSKKQVRKSRARTATRVASPRVASNSPTLQQLSSPGRSFTTSVSSTRAHVRIASVSSHIVTSTTSPASTVSKRATYHTRSSAVDSLPVASAITKPSTQLALPKRHMSTTSAETPSFQYLTMEQKGPTMYVTMNRPEVHNAFNEHVIAELTTAFKTISKSVDEQLKVEPVATKDSKIIRSVVLAGNGASFSAGADLNWMAKMAKYTEEENRLDSLALYDMFHSIHSCPVPVIARVNGAALGGGSGLVAACDFAYALKTAKLGFTEVALGLVPAVISPFCIGKIGSVHAKRYFVTGERFGADEAMRIGLVQEVFNTVEELDKGIEKITSIINNNSPAATRRAKQLVKDISEQSLTVDKPETRDFTASVIAKIRVSDEGQAGLNAFLSKQTPPWKL